MPILRRPGQATPEVMVHPASWYQMGRRASGCGHRAGYALPGIPCLATSAPPVGFPEASRPGAKHVPEEIILHFLPCVMKHLPLNMGTLLPLVSSGPLTPRSI